MKTALTLIGIVALAMGLLWMGQGSGYIPWPASSFMISQTVWIYYGAALAVVGLVLIIFARRRR
jgi:NhaP-type Na+/H+ or K+/H+ antiporter